MGSGDFSSQTLLLVDDLPDNLLVLQEIMREYLPGCTVLTARSAEEVLSLAGRAALAGALIDVQMPGMDGIEMCRRLKAMRSIPIMLLTSHATDARLRAQGLDAGADDFVCRPIDNIELVARVKVMLRIREAEDKLRQVNAHLEEMVEERTEELRQAATRYQRVARRLQVVEDEERKRLSRELHDGLGQTLTSLCLTLDWLREQIVTDPGEAALRAVDDAMILAKRASAEMRHVCGGLRPPLLDELGLEAAARELVREFTERTGVEASLAIDLGEPGQVIPSTLAVCTFRILQESLQNVSRHARAMKVAVSLRCDGEALSLSVTDDGCGFATNVRGRRSGLTGMRERAGLVDGAMELRSAPGEGTEVRFKAPLKGSSSLGASDSGPGLDG